MMNEMSPRKIGDLELENSSFTLMESDGLKPCEECRACCTVIGVVEIPKQNYQRCRHLCKAGCKIYETKPKSCSEYQCWYTMGLVGKRPDKIGLIVDFKMNPLPGLIRVWEVRKGAADTRKGRRFISKLLQYDSEIVVANQEQTKFLRSGLIVPTPKDVHEAPIDEGEQHELSVALKQLGGELGNQEE